VKNYKVVIAAPRDRDCRTWEFDTEEEADAAATVLSDTYNGPGEIRRFNRPPGEWVQL
jgi:hypothetical protein